MDKKIEQTTEQQHEEFDYLSDFYFPLKEVEDKYSSPILKRLRENEIDPHEFLGIEKVEGTGAQTSENLHGDFDGPIFSSKINEIDCQ